MKRGFSPATFVLVALLLGVLVFVGRLVDPNSNKDAGKDAHNEEQPNTAQNAPIPKNEAPKLDEKKLDPNKPTVIGEQPKLTPAQQQKMDAMNRMHAQKAKEAMQASAKGGKPARPSTAPDGMDPALWQERDMGQVAPKAEVKP